MSENEDQPEEELPEFEVVTGEPHGCILGEGDIAIFDTLEFEEAHNCTAAWNKEGLWVLDRETKKWRSVEVKENKGKLATVKKEQGQ